MSSLVNRNTKQIFLKKNILHHSEQYIYQIFFNPFVDIALTFFDSSFNSILFDLKLFSLLPKLFFTNLAISFLLAKFTCLSFAVKFSDVSLSNS